MKSVLPVLLLVWTASRLTAADFTVLNTNNSGPGSLHQAITDANNTPGADRIRFNIPGAGVHRIDVNQNPLPKIIESLEIDGYSQPGASPNSLPIGNNAVILIQIEGGIESSFVGREGLVFDRGTGPNGQGYLASNYSVRGLALTGFVRAIRLVEASSLVIAGNFVGLRPDGHTRGINSAGITFDGLSIGPTIIGGADPGSRNVISGNGRGLEALKGARVTVQGNYLGTDVDGRTAVPNERACVFAGDLHETAIGGTTAGTGNVISGNAVAAIQVGNGFATPVPSPGNGVRISGNLIGLQADGVQPLGNRGWAIELIAGTDNLIGGLEAGAGNVIAYNTLGVVVGGINAYEDTPPPVRNRILSNAIYGNSAVGIDLGNDGPTANDEGDVDTGPNGLQNSPIIESTEIANGLVTIKGRLNSTPNTQFTLQYFSDSLDLVRPVQAHLGGNMVSTDGSGSAQFSATFPVSNANVSFNVTATSQDGNTSEFSRNAPRMLNISTRGNVQSGDRALIAGFIVRSVMASRETIVRALGPSLSDGNSGLLQPLSDPYLEFHYPGGYFVANDNWRDASNSGYLAVFGLTPPDERESALFMPYTLGPHTVVVRGAHGETGIALAEVYDGRAGAFGGFGDVGNISTRGFVGTGDEAMIAGTILEQTDGMARIVARALGPSLAAAGVSDPLADPVLELRNDQGALVGSNDNWRDGQRDALIAVGLAPSNDNESAIFMRLPSGAYTAIVRGKGTATGIALVELYNLH